MGRPEEWVNQSWPGPKRADQRETIKVLPQGARPQNNPLLALFLAQDPSYMINCLSQLA